MAITRHCICWYVADDVIPGEEDAAEDGGGWDVGDDLELPTDLVSYYYTTNSQVLVVHKCVICQLLVFIHT